MVTPARQTLHDSETVHPLSRSCRSGSRAKPRKGPLHARPVSALATARNKLLAAFALVAGRPSSHRAYDSQAQGSARPSGEVTSSDLNVGTSGGRTALLVKTPSLETRGASKHLVVPKPCRVVCEEKVAEFRRSLEELYVLNCQVMERARLVATANFALATVILQVQRVGVVLEKLFEKAAHVNMPTRYLSKLDKAHIEKAHNHMEKVWKPPKRGVPRELWQSSSTVTQGCCSGIPPPDHLRDRAPRDTAQTILEVVDRAVEVVKADYAASLVAWRELGDLWDTVQGFHSEKVLWLEQAEKILLMLMSLLGGFEGGIPYRHRKISTRLEVLVIHGLMEDKTVILEGKYRGIASSLPAEVWLEHLRIQARRSAHDNYGIRSYAAARAARKSYMDRWERYVNRSGSPLRPSAASDTSFDNSLVSGGV